MIHNPVNIIKLNLCWAVVMVCACILIPSCKKKQETTPPVINNYTVKYQVRYVGCPTTTPFTITYYQGGGQHTTFVAIAAGELVKYWNLTFTAQTGDYVNLKCTPPQPPEGYQTLCTVSIEATPSATPFYVENTASYPATAEVKDSLP
jgi:hypothetical protein